MKKSVSHLVLLYDGSQICMGWGFRFISIITASELRNKNQFPGFQTIYEVMKHSITQSLKLISRNFPLSGCIKFQVHFYPIYSTKHLTRISAYHNCAENLNENQPNKFYLYSYSETVLTQIVQLLSFQFHDWETLKEDSIITHFSGMLTLLQNIPPSLS